MSTTFFATRISENISRTPEGFLVCKDVPLARTGWQRYMVAELHVPAETLGELGLTDPTAFVEVYRPEEEVFSPATVASAEGKSVTLLHPAGFVDPENFRQLTRGHIQNVHKGAEQLDDGNWPLVGNLIITDAEAIQAVDAGTRDVSLGYDYALCKIGDQLVQTKIRINHCAIVPEGRAGPEVRINDAASAAVALAPNDIDYVLVVEQASPGPKDRQQPIQKKGERRSMKVTDQLKRVFGLGLQTMAKDGASPEELSEAAQAVSTLPSKDADPEEEKRKEEDAMRHRREEDSARREEDMKRRESDAVAKDEEFKRKEEDMKRREEDMARREEDIKKQKDAFEAPHHAMPCNVADCKDGKCMMHDSLHGIMTHPKTTDADLEELGNVFKQFMQEESREPEHQDKDMEPIPEAPPPAEKTQIVEPEDPEGGEPPVAARDAKAKAEMAELKRTKAAVARSGDAAKIADWNARAAKYRSSREGHGAYHEFAGAAGVGRENAIDDSTKYDALQKTYNERLKGPQGRVA